MVLAPTEEIQGEDNVKSQEARPGKVVRVREGYRRPELEGMRGTVRKCWGSPEYRALDIELEDGRSELLWFHQVEAVGERRALRQKRLLRW